MNINLEDIKEIISTILAVIGALTLVFGFIKLLSDVIPKIRTWKQNCISYIGAKYNYKKCKKLAIENDIEDTVNETVFSLQKELPAQWLSKAKIEWVEEEKAETLKDDEIILRIRPSENQDSTLINGIYIFLKKIIFPTTKDIIPENIKEAVALHISRRTIEHKKEYLLKKFEEEFLEKSVKENPNLTTYLEKYELIDKKGLFIGTFLREAHEIATRARFKDLRNKMEAELNEILEHIMDFANKISKVKEETMWSREGPATSYAFLLVARPGHGGTYVYLNKAKERAAEGIERLYVMGASEEINFFKKVIQTISQQTSYKLTEIFNLNRDYRADKGGIGALFVSGVLAKEEEEMIESLQERSAGGLKENKSEQTTAETIKTIK